MSQNSKSQQLNDIDSQLTQIQPQLGHLFWLPRECFGLDAASSTVATPRYFLPEFKELEARLHLQQVLLLQVSAIAPREVGGSNRNLRW